MNFAIYVECEVSGEIMDSDRFFGKKWTYLVIVQLLEVNQKVIPAEAGIYDENHILSGFPIKTFGNDKFLCLVGALSRAELLPYLLQ